jgi:hypothetical protein
MNKNLITKNKDKSNIKKIKKILSHNVNIIIYN